MTPTVTAAAIRGRQAEELACAYLVERGLRCVARNYRCARGEIDLIMQHGTTIVFVEVRYRRSSRYGSSAESVDGRKQARLIATAQHYLQASRATAPARFDVIAVALDHGRHAIEWIPNAFEA